MDASGAGGSPASAFARDASSVNEALPLVSSPTEAHRSDAQMYLLELIRDGKPLFVRRIQRGDAACVAVELRPSLPDGSVGEILFGGQRGRYAVHQGYLRTARVDRGRDLFFGETWPVHGVARDGVLISGALFATSKEGCEANLTHRPLALYGDRCGAVPELGKGNRAEATGTPWVFNDRGLLPPSRCRRAGAYFSNGTRYPFELFWPLGRAWITGPLAGGSGQPRIVDLGLESGHLKLGDLVFDEPPVVLSYPPVSAEPALVETGAHDFARDLLAEKRPLYVPLLRENGVECAAVDLSKFHGKFRVPTYSGRWQKLEYTKEDLGVAVWHASFVRGLPGGRLGFAGGACPYRPDYLSAHGRDADSYHVSGSRWFLDEAECERQRTRVLPSLVHIANLEDDGCGRADSRLVARPSVLLKTGTYFFRPSDATSCVPVEVVGREGSWPQSWYVRMRNASPSSGPDGFIYQDVARGRFLWRGSPDSLDGELLEMKPLKRGVQVGDTRWYRDKPSCEGS